MAMSLIRRKGAKPGAAAGEERLLSLREAAELLCLSESAIRQRKAGTEHLTLVRQGRGQRRRIFLVRSEVEAHLRSLIDDARMVNELRLDEVLRR
jgi:hypothetical protein